MNRKSKVIATLGNSTENILELLIMVKKKKIFQE